MTKSNTTQATVKSFKDEISALNLPPLIGARLDDAFERAMRRFSERLGRHKLWWVDTEDQREAYVYQAAGKLLWMGRKLNPCSGHDLRDAAIEIVKNIPAISGQKWRLSSLNQLNSVTHEIKNAKYNNNALNIINDEIIDPSESIAAIDIIKENYKFSRRHSNLNIRMSYVFSNEEALCAYGGLAFPCASFDMSPAEFIQVIRQEKWRLHPVEGDEKDAIDHQALTLAALLPPAFSNLDHDPCRLPRLDRAQLTDPDKGLWELWGAAPQALAGLGLRARDPAQDVRDWSVAIDFGTSSTVVAYDDDGRHKLLRVGVRDFLSPPEPKHYENPTVLEFIDFQQMLKAWREIAYRPAVNWDDVRCSHEALHNLRNNETDAAVVSSILPKIKQWALRQGADRKLRLLDQKCGFEHELAPLSPRNPAKGQALAVGPSDPFDPIELYAWFLGLNVNWRGRGICLRYYMTFPVAYPREVKENILAAFRRGLQRSLPASLVADPVFGKFSVEELASEPLAYAAAALPRLGVEPTAKGEAYAVFDFGGGTTDFDFGLYRLPTPEEEARGTEIVLEHLGNEGDRFLGGENLLENMAYLTFQENLRLCAEQKIVFSKPLDAQDFPGSELFLEKTQAAATNSLMLMSRLRPLWEAGELANSSGVERLSLLNHAGEKAACEFVIPVEKLETYLKRRISAGLRDFFIATKAAFAETKPKRIHVLLAGNSSRSALAMEVFGLGELSEDLIRDARAEGAEEAWFPIFDEDQPSDDDGAFGRLKDWLVKLFDGEPPEIVVHPAFSADPQDPYAPTAKTGVALGLLKLCPGGPVDVISHSQRAAGEQAPFAHYVGPLRRASFQPVLAPGTPYQEWREFGPPREGVANLFHSQSPKAKTGEMAEGESGLHKKRLDLIDAKPGTKVFLRAVAPNSVEFCVAASREDLDQGAPPQGLRRIDFLH